MKTKVPFLGIGGSILFVLLGIHLIYKKSAQDSEFHPLFIKSVGVACILIFGTLLVLTLLKIIKNEKIPK